MKTASAFALCALTSLALGCSGDNPPAGSNDSDSTGPTSTSGASTGTSPSDGTSTSETGDVQTSSTAEADTTAADTSGGQTESAGSSDSTGAGMSSSSSETSAGTGFFPDVLECNSISLCSTYDADQSAPTFPKGAGGALEDGLYRAVQGTSEPFGLAISGDRYALIFEGLTASFGDLSINGETMTQVQTAVCSSNGVVELDPQSFDFVFWTQGDELFTYSGCPSLDPDVCGSGTRYVRVNSLCEDLGSLGCEGNDCECHTFADDIPKMPKGCGF